MVLAAVFGDAAEPRYVGFDEECGHGPETPGFEPWFGSEQGISIGERDAKRCYPPGAAGSYHAVRTGSLLLVGGVLASAVSGLFLGLRRGPPWWGFHGSGIVLCSGFFVVLALLIGFADVDIAGLGGAPEPPDGFDDAAVILYRSAFPVFLCGAALALLPPVVYAGRRPGS